MFRLSEQNWRKPEFDQNIFFKGLNSRSGLVSLARFKPWGELAIFITTLSPNEAKRDELISRENQYLQCF
jgi:hypothetical protein